MTYDVVAVNLKTRLVRVMATNKLLPDAEAFVDMAVRRRRVEEEFFAEVPHGTYKDGDTWSGRRN